MNLAGIHELVQALCHLAVFLLVAVAVTSVVIFFKVFKADFSEQD
jgi:hypothetical protein